MNIREAILWEASLLLFANGFELCDAGWLTDKKAGWVMQQGRPGCGDTGYNEISSDPDVDTKYSTYCIGTIPNSKEVIASITLIK